MEQKKLQKSQASQSLNEMQRDHIREWGDVNAMSHTQAISFSESILTCPTGTLNPTVVYKSYDLPPGEPEPWRSGYCQTEMVPIISMTKSELLELKDKYLKLLDQINERLEVKF